MEIRRDVQFIMIVILGIVSSSTYAECPNGCSGNGACMAKDMCNCYKNYLGNDCFDRACQFGYAHADTPKGDINMDQDRKTPNWIIKDSQQFPEGTYEYFSPDAATDEAHFYMECSNKGICDRTLGTCTCFDGYEGVACQRASCPNKCSGHGTCESLRELGLKAPGTLFGNPYSASQITYDLWDSRVIYGCRCDPWYHGADCSLRSCKAGVDPMFLSVGTATFETFVLHVYTTGTWTADAAGATPLNFFRLRLFDYHGESYVTEAIPILNDVSDTAKADSNAAAVAKAIKRIPNQTFRRVLCERLSLTNGDLDGYILPARETSKGLSVICQLYDNPGELRKPEVAAFGFNGITDPLTKKYQVITVEKGISNEWFTEDTGMVVTAVSSSDYVTLTLESAQTGSPETPTLFKLGPYVVAGKLSAATTITLTYPLKHTLSSRTSRFNAVKAANGNGGMVVTELVSTAVVAGSTIITVTSNPNFAAGDLVFFENQFYNYVSSVVNGANWDITLDRPFLGNTLDGGDNTVLFVYKVTPPANALKYNYVSQCSGRGICDTETGICDCFKGYTNDNCDTQNILAL
ncbi:putative EGF-like domain-containing protein [Plasmopara halstedii]